MKNYFFLSLLLLVILTDKTFGQNKFGIDSAAYYTSLNHFETAKSKHGNSYQFSIFDASFTGYWTKTTFIVQQGKVVERHYESGNDYNKEHQGKSWKESGNELGSHKEEGVAVLTMDDVYANAKNWIAKKTSPKTTSKDNDISILDNNEYYFSTDKQGLIETAGLRPKECMDDCFRGYHIRDFSWLSESNKIDTKGKKGKKDKKKRKQ